MRPPPISWMPRSTNWGRECCDGGLPHFSTAHQSGRQAQEEESEHICLQGLKASHLESKSSELDKLGSKIANEHITSSGLTLITRGAALSVRLWSDQGHSGRPHDASSVEEVLLMVEEQGEVFNKVLRPLRCIALQRSPLRCRRER